MKPATRRWFVMSLLGVLMLGCAWAVWDSRRPPPEPLQRAEGRVTQVRFEQRRGRNDQVYFRLEGQAREFNYSQGLPGVEEAMQRLRVGSHVEVLVGPRGGFDLWGLRVDGQTLLTPQERQQSLQRGGYVALALLLAAAWLLRWLWKLMRARESAR